MCRLICVPLQKIHYFCNFFILQVTLSKGIFTLDVSINGAMSLATYFWLNYINVLKNQASHSKNGLQSGARNQSLALRVNKPEYPTSKEQRCVKLCPMCFNNAYSFILHGETGISIYHSAPCRNIRQIWHLLGFHKFPIDGFTMGVFEKVYFEA